ncbi:hypothetical protein EYF80_032591 [Liparis tanakae]|uniref:Uncharacterized protein n=1 Tax=Liparis tanakae TaxID=230148 RepID=A0A4Z2GUX2_9TELE|nr:hypothetical protein EYF80_032591 [Liparis tanakae]
MPPAMALLISPAPSSLPPSVSWIVEVCIVVPSLVLYQIVLCFSDRAFHRGGKGEVAAEEEALTPLLACDVGEARVETGRTLRPPGGGCRFGGGGDGSFRSSICAASFSSVALRSAIRSAMSASRSVSSSSLRDSGVTR